MTKSLKQGKQIKECLQPSCDIGEYRHMPLRESVPYMLPAVDAYCFLNSKSPTPTPCLPCLAGRDLPPTKGKTPDTHTYFPRLLCNVNIGT